MRFQVMRSLLAGVLSVSMLTGPIVAQAAGGSAAVMGTEAMLQQQAAGDARATVSDYFSRDDVRDQLQAWGVAPNDAEARVAAMSDAELAELASQIENAPAGAGVLEVIGITFVVLIILELLGVTNIFRSI